MACSAELDAAKAEARALRDRQLLLAVRELRLVNEELSLPLSLDWTILQHSHGATRPAAVSRSG
jgi:hypothetical protein